MKLKHILNGALVLAFAIPLAIAVYGLENCCYGTVCPSVSGCNIRASNGTWQCKRTCSSGCKDGNGCCQFRIRHCEYVPIPPNESCRDPFDAVWDVHWTSYTHCYADGGGYVACQATNDEECKQ